MIEAVGLTRRFGATVAVDGLDFRVEPGEIVGFLGPNGAGKTTTMRMLTGTLPPSRGQALVAGLDVADASLAVRRKVGFMPEHVPLYTDQTVLGLLHYVAELKNVDRSTLANHLDDIMERVGLTDMAKRLVGHLSKGYRQRVGLAQALVGDPEVLILDEPTAGLDPHQIVEIRELIRSYHGTRTVLLSSHILGEVEKVCDRVLIMNQGRLVSNKEMDSLRGDGGLEAAFLRLTGGMMAHDPEAKS
jgi:ABC-2 type transport system ATP-binding protein